MTKLKHGRIRETMKTIGRACLKAAAPLAVAAALYFSPNLALADTCRSKVRPMTTEMATKKVDWQKRGRRYLFFRMYIPLDENRALVVRIPDRFMRKNRKLTREGFGKLTLVNGNQAIALYKPDKTQTNWQWKCLKVDEPIIQLPPVTPPAPTVRLPAGVTGKGTQSEPYKLTVNLKGGGVMIAVPASLSRVGSSQFYWNANISYSPTNHTSKDVSTELAKKLYALMRAATGQRPGFQGVLDDLHAKMQEMNKSSNYQMWPGEKPKGSSPAPGSGSKPKIKPPKSGDPLEGILGEEDKAPDRPATAQEQENMAKWLENMKKRAATGRTGQPPKPRLFDRKNPMEAFKAPPYGDQIKAAIKMAKKKAISGKLLIVIRIDPQGKPTSVQFSSNDADMKRAMADGDNKDMKNLLSKLRAIFMRMRWKKQNIPAITYSPIIR